MDMDRLESWPLDNLTTARGFTCEKCKSREAISYSTPLFEEALKRLTQLRPGHRKFMYHFRKALLRAEAINRRNNGTRGHLHMAPS